MLSISRRNFITLGAGLFATSALAGCGGGSSAEGSSSSEGGPSAASGTYKIGVLQLTEHGALDQTNEGFVAALDESGIDAKIDQQNAQNDQSACQTIASKLVNDGDDLIFAIATPAAQAVAGATSDIPVVGSAITDYAESGLVDSNDAPGGNVTGTSDLTPVADQIDLLHQLLPDAKTVGILFCSAESNSEVQVQLAEEALTRPASRTSGTPCRPPTRFNRWSNPWWERSTRSTPPPTTLSPRAWRPFPWSPMRIRSPSS